jgi:mRNA-degrading endonuclease YafQ of YafQ-DinJ toxin-antitoxin module
MNIVYTKKFEKMFKRLPISIKNQAVQKEAVFMRYPFSQTLKVHKLKGKFEGYYAFSIDFHYRIIFRLIENDSALFIAIGDHSIYQ